MVELLKSDTYGGATPPFLCYTNLSSNKPMRCKVQLYVAGKVFNEMVEARDYQEARQVALARNPNAKIVGVTAVF